MHPVVASGHFPVTRWGAFQGKCATVPLLHTHASTLAMIRNHIPAPWKRTARRFLAGVGWRHWVDDEPMDADLDHASPVEDAAALIAELGLVEDRQPIGAYAWWQPPRCVMVLNATRRRVEWLRQAAPHVELLAPQDANVAVDLAPEVDGIIGWYVPELMARASRLQWLQTSAAGMDTLPNAAQLARRDFIITNMQKAAAPAIAEHAIAMLFAVSRGLHHHSMWQRVCKWMPSAIRLADLPLVGGKTLLVVGMGGIGGRIARLGHGLGMKVQAIRARSLPVPEWVGRQADLHALPEMIGEADIVIDALPSTNETRHVFDDRMFRRMKRSAIFINVGRGTTVDTNALTTCLASGIIAAAALDVVEPEPLPRSHPLWRLPNVLITPHIAGRSLATLQYEWLIKRENLRRFAAGERMLSVVDLERGY